MCTIGNRLRGEFVNFIDKRPPKEHIRMLQKECVIK